MNIVDWFDVNNPTHVRAYNNLMKTGAWEKGFIPVGMEFPPNWQVLVAGKLADTYVQKKIADNLFVVRLYDGFDHEWIDVSKLVTKVEAEKILAEKTEGGTKNTKFEDIDYYAIFPADTTMWYSAKGVYKDRGKTVVVNQDNVFCACGGVVRVTVRETNNNLDGINMYCTRCNKDLSYLIEYKNERAGDLD